MPSDDRPAHEHARALVLFASCLGFAVVQLDVSVVNVAIKSIGAQLGGGVGGLQWVVSAYTVTFASLILTAGALGDRIGARRVFVAGFVVFTLASALCGLAPNLGVLIAARAVQGIGAAALVPCSLTLLNHTFSGEADRARAVGIWAAGASVALGGGPLIGGALIASLGWRAIFFINAPVGAIGVAATLRWASETTRSSARGIDLRGQATAVLALAATAGATIEGGARGFTDPFVLGAYALAIISAAAFLRTESRARSAMLPLGLFRSRTFSAASIIGLLVNVVFYGLIFVLSLYFQSQRGYSPVETGLAFVPVTAAVMLANVLSGRIARARGPRMVLTAGALLMAASLVALLPVGNQTSYAGLAGQLVVLGFGLGLIVPVMTSALLGSVERERSGVASGTLNTARQSGSVLGVALFGSLSAGGSISGLHTALAISAVLAALSGAAALAVD
jgi:MFS transporter, DHA2 family, methylenomycin A resistance protein